MTVTDVASAIDLPRTTAYRVLETLCSAGLPCGTVRTTVIG